MHQRWSILNDKSRRFARNLSLETFVDSGARKPTRGDRLIISPARSEVTRQENFFINRTSAPQRGGQQRDDATSLSEFNLPSMYYSFRPFNRQINVDLSSFLFLFFLLLFKLQPWVRGSHGERNRTFGRAN